VSIFKEKTNLSVEYNIAKNIFSTLGDEVPNEISQLELNDELTIDQYYKACLLYCKNRIFDLSYLDDKILLHDYVHFRSISMIAETLKVLRIDLGYDEKMVSLFYQINFFLLHKMQFTNQIEITNINICFFQILC